MNHTTESIWNACNQKIFAFIRKHVADEFISEELLQEIFIKIHKSIDDLKDQTKIHNWVFQIARNTITDHYRKNKKQFIGAEEKVLFNEVEQTINEDSNDENLNEEIILALKPMVDSLPDKYSQALKMVEFEGMSQVKLAKELGISVSGAKSRIQRARKLIKDQLMRCCHYEFDKYGNAIGIKPGKCCCCNDEN